LVGTPVFANAVVTLGVQQPGTQTPITYQWTIAGGRITSDPRAPTIQFVADRPGTVLLGAAIAANGTVFTPTADVVVLAPEDAGIITVTPTVAADAPSVTASVPAGQNGDRTFRWVISGDGAILSGQGTPQITFRPGAAGLKEVRCNVNLQEIVTVPVRAYVVVAGTGNPVSVTVNNGTGGGTYRAGSRVDISAFPAPAGQVFDRWTGTTEVFGTGALAPSLNRLVFTVPATPVTLAATYKAAPVWTLLTVANFNPQIPANPAAPQVAVASALAYHVPANPVGLVFLLHAAGGSHDDWFTQLEHAAFVRDLVAAGYGVAALNSVNRTTGNWAGADVLANNLDALNHVAAVDQLVREGRVTAATPLFFLGHASGAPAAVRYADLLAKTPTGRSVKGAILYCAAGIETLAAISPVPQYFALAANDASLGVAGLGDARDNSQLLLGRGVATGIFSNPIAPVHAGRFRALALRTPTFTPEDAEAVWLAVKNAGLLDANLYPMQTPNAAELAPLLPTAYRSRAAEIAGQLAVAAAEGLFYRDANARVIAFLNARVANAAVPAPGRLVNISTRSKIAYVGDTFALGFNLGGTQRATLLIRGIGPALLGFGLSEALPAPRLEINQGSRQVATNEGWEKNANAAQLRTAAETVGAFALAPGSADAALLVQLDPGTYTVTLRGLAGTTGDVLAEIYDVSRNGTRLTNLSTLARIGSEGELLIPGIVVAGNNPRTLLVRAVGPGLTDFGLGADSVLGDPRISILNGTQTVAINNNWAQGGAATLTATFPAVGAFPLRPGGDSALLMALAPGTYTVPAGAAPVVVAPNAPNPAPTPNPTGSVLVEIYEVP